MSYARLSLMAKRKKWVENLFVALTESNLEISICVNLSFLKPETGLLGIWGLLYCSRYDRSLSRVYCCVFSLSLSLSGFTENSRILLYLCWISSNIFTFSLLNTRVWQKRATKMKRRTSLLDTWRSTILQTRAMARSNGMWSVVYSRVW